MIRHHERHGGTYLPEYKVWEKIKERCYNKKNKSYKNYGGRGILMCDEWRCSFANFYKDMGKRPSPKHQIDRIDNNMGYYKSNCRWVLPMVNQNNKRNSILSYEEKQEIIDLYLNKFEPLESLAKLYYVSTEYLLGILGKDIIEEGKIDKWRFYLNQITE